MALHPDQPKPRLLRRGGARNRRDRQSHALTERDCRKLLEGCDVAYAIGAPMTRWTTLAWERAGIEPIDCGRMTGKFLSLQRDWLRKRGFAMPWCWTLETGNKCGAHAHVLSHVPTELDPLYSPMPRRWATMLLGGTYAKGVVKSEALQYRAAAFANPDVYLAELRGKQHYMLKAAPAELELALGMIGFGHAPWGQLCRTYGKRAGVWQYRNKG